ncbi:hypothetical protein TNCV_5029141 [Trichonephila clavipes]|nr:hypothetical protein TNCV_5029141 [Trichonephila clavipes]
MGDDVMEIHASQSDESLMDDLSPRPSSSGSLREHVRRLDDLPLSPGTASTMTMQVRGYNCVRRDVDGDTSPTGGVCLFTSNLFPSNVVTLHTSLQAVAVRIHVHSLVTVCCVYLPPNDVVPQVDLNHLVSQLPAPFILLGDFNGHSPLWGHDVTNSSGRKIEQLISDHCLC